MPSPPARILQDKVRPALSMSKNTKKNLHRRSGILDLKSIKGRIRQRGNRPSRIPFRLTIRQIRQCLTTIGEG